MFLFTPASLEFESESLEMKIKVWRFKITKNKVGPVTKVVADCRSRQLPVARLYFIPMTAVSIGPSRNQFPLK